MMFNLSIKCFYFILASVFLVSCASTRSITERYIKTEIEDHNIGETKSSTIHLIYQTSLALGNDYIELAGFIDDDQKKLTIAGDKIYKYRSSFKGDPTTLRQVAFINLNEGECELILKNYKGMFDRIKDRKAKSSKEVVYEDLTINEDLFVSFSKHRVQGIRFSIWMYGEKYTIGGKKFYESLKDFMELD